MYKEGIDFVIVSYCKHDYVRLCVESIKKFVDIPYTIHVVVNYLEKEKEMNLHREMFKDKENVIVLKGCDQSTTLDKVDFQDLYNQKIELVLLIIVKLHLVVIMVLGQLILELKMEIGNMFVF